MPIARMFIVRTSNVKTGIDFDEADCQLLQLTRLARDDRVGKLSTGAYAYDYAKRVSTLFVAEGVK